MFQMSFRWKNIIYYLVFTLKWLVLISLICHTLSFILIIVKAILVRFTYIYLIIWNKFLYLYWVYTMNLTKVSITAWVTLTNKYWKKWLCEFVYANNLPTREAWKNKYFQPSREPPLILLWNKYQLTGSRVYGTIFERITGGQCQVVSPLCSVLMFCPDHLPSYPGQIKTKHQCSHCVPPPGPPLGGIQLPALQAGQDASLHLIDIFKSPM